MTVRLDSLLPTIGVYNMLEMTLFRLEEIDGEEAALYSVCICFSKHGIRHNNRRRTISLRFIYIIILVVIVIIANDAVCTPLQTQDVQ